MSIVELEALGEFVVENHGGYYSDGQWVSGVIKAVDNSIAGRWPTSVIFVSNDANKLRTRRQILRF